MIKCPYKIFLVIVLIGTSCSSDDDISLSGRLKRVEISDGVDNLAEVYSYQYNNQGVSQIIHADFREGRDSLIIQYIYNESGQLSIRRDVQRRVRDQIYYFETIYKYIHYDSDIHIEQYNGSLLTGWRAIPNEFDTPGSPLRRMEIRLNELKQAELIKIFEIDYSDYFLNGRFNFEYDSNGNLISRKEAGFGFVYYSEYDQKANPYTSVYDYDPLLKLYIPYNSEIMSVNNFSKMTIDQTEYFFELEYNTDNLLVNKEKVKVRYINTGDSYYEPYQSIVNYSYY